MVKTMAASAQQQTQADQSQNAGNQSVQSQNTQGSGQYVSGSYDAAGTWSNISSQQKYDDFWNDWVWAQINSGSDTTDGRLTYWACTSARGAEWKAAFDRYGIHTGMFADTTSGASGTVTHTTPAGIGGEVNGDGSITVTITYKMGG